MKHNNQIQVATTVVLLVVIAWLLAGNKYVVGQETQSNKQWEYAYFVFQSDTATIKTGSYEVDVSKRHLNRVQQFLVPPQYQNVVAQSRAISDYELRSLDFFGNLGWEVIAVIPTSNELRLLMRRPY